MRHLSTVYTGKEDLLKLRAKIGPHPSRQILIQAYCGISGQEEIALLRSRLLRFFPNTGILGASSAGEIVNAQVQKGSIVIGVTLFDHTVVQTALIRQNDDLVAAGRAMGASLGQIAPQVVIVFGCGLKDGRFVNNISFLKALYDTLGGVPLAGGQAGGYDDQHSRVFVFTEEGMSEEGFAAAALSGDRLCLHTAHNLGWAPIGKSMTVTCAEGNRLYSVDGISAGKIYEKYLGIEPNPSSVYLINNFPLMIKRGSVQATTAISRIHQDGSFELVQEVRAGEQVRFSFCDISLQEEGAKRLRQEIEEYGPEVIFVYTCICRMELFGKDIVVDMEALEGCENADGFFTFGEYFTEYGQVPSYFQQTMTVLALSEGTCCLPDKQYGRPVEFKSNRPDLRRFHVLKVLSHLVASTTRELESTNQKLAEQAKEDSLTGLSNRRLFDEILSDRLKEHNRSATAMSLILVDVDFFKEFNDFYGHVVGDDCLRGIAQILGREVKRTSDMAFRYGGEEFACILSFTDHAAALVVAEGIRTGVKQLKIPHERSGINEYVTVSIGVLTVVHPGHDLSPDVLIRACDALLYMAKRGGRNRTVAQVFDENAS